MESKFAYNLKGIARMLIPRYFPQSNLEKIITKIFLDSSDTDLEMMAKRIAFYHQIQKPFSITPLTLESKPNRLSNVSPHFGILKDNKPSNLYSSVYYYDSFESSRYFDDALKWYYEFGDVNYYLNAPAITKSRPINPKILESTKIDSPYSFLDSIYVDSSGANANSILLKLEKHRHFAFINDPIAFEDKKDILFFRGGCYQPHRIKFLEQYFSHPLCDIGHTGSKQICQEFTKPKISIKEHLPYKFLLSLEGNDVASNLKWILSSNSLCVMPTPRYETWFIESALKPEVHYCHIKDDYSDVQEKLEFYISHPNEAKQIIENAHRFCATFYNHRIERALNLLVLRKYFYLSGQIEISKQEKELFGLG